MEKTGDCRLEMDCLLGWLGRTVTPATVSSIVRRLTQTVNADARQNAHFLMASIVLYHPLHYLQSVIKARVLGDEIMKWESELKAKRLATPPRNVGHLTVYEGGRLPTGYEVESKGYIDRLLRLFIKPRRTAQLVQEGGASDTLN